MKIVMLNAATLPVYRDELARLLIEASKQGITAGLPPLSSSKKRKMFFTIYALRSHTTNCYFGLPGMSKA